MRRTIGGLTALLVSFAVLNNEGADGAITSTCLQSMMFNFGDGTAMYAANCYTAAANCNDVGSMTMCSWSGSYSGTLPEPCDNTTGCTPKDRGPAKGLRKKEVFVDDAGEKMKLGNQAGSEFTIIASDWVTFPASKQGPKAGKAKSDTVTVRLVQIQWNKPTRTPKDLKKQDLIPPVTLTVGYEVDSELSDGAPAPAAIGAPDGDSPPWNNDPKAVKRAIKKAGVTYEVHLCLTSFSNDAK